MTTEIATQEGQEVQAVENRRAVLPAIDIFENEAQYLIVADMPGVPTSGLTLRFHAGELTIEGVPANHQEAAPLDERLEPVRYVRSFRVPRSVDPEHIAASLAKGVLQVTLPKRESMRPRQIHVKAG